MELLGKAADAALMFWQALDERERMLVLYALAWLLFMLGAAAAQRSRGRLKQELREELAHGSRA